jgi:3-oxoadipate enol-lactonase
MNAQFIQANGVRTAYRIDGPSDAPVVVLSNSLMSTMQMWEPQMPVLAAYRVLRYDTRGHGQSAVPEGPYTIAAMAGDVVGLLEALGIATAHFVGLSMGGMIGQYLGANHGGRVRSLTLSNTASEMPPRSMWEQRFETARTRGVAGLVDTTIQRWFTAPFITAAPDVIAEVRKMILSTPDAGYIASGSAVRDMSQTSLLSRIEVPTNIICGELDPACTPQQGQVLRDHIRGAELHVLQGCAHLSNIESTAAFNATLLEFLDKQPR